MKILKIKTVAKLCIYSTYYIMALLGLGWQGNSRYKFFSFQQTLLINQTGMLHKQFVEFIMQEIFQFQTSHVFCCCIHHSTN